MFFEKIEADKKFIMLIENLYKQESGLAEI